jgi:hypothetical protein
MTSDNAQAPAFVCEWAQIGESNVKGTFNKIDNPVSNADTYCEISFAKEAGILAPGGTTNIIPFRIEQGGSFTQSNDYSFNANIATALGENTKISGYVNGILKFGTEPVKITPSQPAGYKVSGYINPGFEYSADVADKLKSGFKVEILNTDKYAITDGSGYFEITGVAANTDGYTLGISKLNYLTRNKTITSFASDVQLGSETAPLALWPGDMAKNGIQDGAINISDIIEISKVFNSTPQDGRYKEAMDINIDGAINLKDVIIIAKYFGKVSSDYPNN